jgi:hypothetical protein
MGTPSLRLTCVSLVVLLGVSLGLGGWLSHRRNDYLRRARVCDRLARLTDEKEKDFSGVVLNEDDFLSAEQNEMLEAKRSPEGARRYLARLHVRRDWLNRMRARFERAARRPWMRVVLDPEPE